MGFDAALRATHDGCSLGDVQLFPVTQQKRLALTWWQPLQLFFNHFNDLRLPKLIFGASPRLGGVSALQSFERVGIFVFPPRREGGKQRDPQRPDLVPAIEVSNRILQDTLEQHRQLFGRLGPVLFRKLEHRILHDVEGVLRIPDREQRLFVRASLNACEKFGKLVSGGQKRFLFRRPKGPRQEWSMVSKARFRCRP
jgi:hypothetical protein